MASKIKVDQLETADGSGTIALQNQLSGMTSASMPSGSVLQVTQTTSITQSSSTASSDVTFLSHSITPTSSSSKVLVSFTFFKGRGANETFYLMRGDTKIAGIGTGGGSYISVGSWYNSDNPSIKDDDYAMDAFSYQYLDSPSTTSSTTYNVGHMSPNSAEFYINRCKANTTGARGRMVMTLMEIAG